MMSRTHQHAGFVLRSFNSGSALRLNVDGHVTVCSVALQPRGHGNVNKIILWLTQRGAKRLGNADDLVGLAVDANLMTDGVHGAKQFVGDFHPDKSYGSTVVIVGIGDVA